MFSKHFRTMSHYGRGMKRVVIAGGIGSGKSTVLRYLRDRGYDTLDADDIARQLSEPGQIVYEAMVDAFGTGILRDGLIDRSFVGDLVFASADNRLRLNALSHGPIGSEIKRLMDASAGKAIFVAIPLLKPTHRSDLDLDEVWTVLSEPTTVVGRLMESRGLTRSKRCSASRLSHQMTTAHRWLTWSFGMKRPRRSCSNLLMIFSRIEDYK